MFLSAIGLTLTALLVFPVDVPLWPVFVFIIMSVVVLIPSTILLATANVGVGFGLLFETLSGIWAAGNPEALIILNFFGGKFNSRADGYLAGQKMGHYSRVPPRAVFRGQILAVLLNCFVFVGMLEWLVSNFDNNGTLCQWNNPSHFVCTDAVLVYASATIYGAFGVRNMYALYPIMPWCFLIGSLFGIAWGLGRRYGPRIRSFLSGTERGELWNKLLAPLSYLHTFEPAVFWAGALNWVRGLSCLFPPLPVPHILPYEHLKPLLT